MIFVTVGTHEQQFNRLLREVDILKKEKIIKEEVFIQTGYSDYEPQYCKWSRFIDFQEMGNYIQNARIVITHGGPASFLSVLEQKKSPIIVPRKFEFDEHVNNHQLDFAKKVFELGYKVYVVENITDLSNLIVNYQNNNENFLSNNNQFNQKLKKLLET